MKHRDAHPSDRELVLAAGGELSRQRAECLRRHLDGCWECRLRARELEDAIAGFVRLHRQGFDPSLPPVAGRRALLKAQLDELAAEEIPAGRVWSPAMLPRLWRIAAPVGVCLLTLVFAVNSARWLSRRHLPAHSNFVAVSVPSPAITPGVPREASRDQVCQANEDRNRDVPVALRRKVFARYGIPDADPRAYEVDYLITPALGGSDDIGNLWPQSYTATIWNARVKDALEDRLRELVCSGDLDLATAQREIATDWIAAYKKYFGTQKPDLR